MQMSSASEAISKMSARFSIGDGILSGLVRDRQDAARRLGHLNATLVKSLAQKNIEREREDEKKLRDEIARLETKVLSIDKKVKEEFPNFEKLTGSQLLSVKDAQKLLSRREALIILAPNSISSKVNVFIVRPEQYRVHTSETDSERLVRSLRRSLTVESGEDFDTSRAYSLYKELLLPAADLLAGVDHLFVVSDGALSSLPLGLLVTEPPVEGMAYKDAAWLAKRYAVTTLPSVSSLKHLRSVAVKPTSEKAFMGFGNPILKNEGAYQQIASAKLIRGFASGDLPGTARELRNISSSLGGDERDIYLLEDATERKVKSLDLTPYNVIAFATHGLMAEEKEGVSEPALVLTSPDKPTELDDGYLTASEVAQLKLNADWVLLSACNTASGETQNSEGLSGLAKAFFYAGTRSLLVSHWKVESKATVKLITGMFRNIANDNSIGKSEALRRSMISLMNDPDEPEYAHPAYWAPFIVVGEGGRR